MKKVLKPLRCSYRWKFKGDIGHEHICNNSRIDHSVHDCICGALTFAITYNIKEKTMQERDIEYLQNIFVNIKVYLMAWSSWTITEFNAVKELIKQGEAKLRESVMFLKQDTKFLKEKTMQEKDRNYLTELFGDILYSHTLIGEWTVLSKKQIENIRILCKKGISKLNEYAVFMKKEEIKDTLKEPQSSETVLLNKPVNDSVNHPKYYNMGKYEVIDVLEDWKLELHESNAVKYIARAKYKKNELEDLKKAVWYLNRKISKLANEQYQNEKTKENEEVKKQLRKIYTYHYFCDNCNNNIYSNKVDVNCSICGNNYKAVPFLRNNTNLQLEDI